VLRFRWPRNFDTSVVSTPASSNRDAASSRRSSRRQRHEPRDVAERRSPQAPTLPGCEFARMPRHFAWLCVTSTPPSTATRASTNPADRNHWTLRASERRRHALKAPQSGDRQVLRVAQFTIGRFRVRWDAEDSWCEVIMASREVEVDNRSQPVV
jgi:hypothetical protein